MFKEIFWFEFKQNLKKPSTYIYFGVLFLLNILFGLALTGVFDTTRSDSNIVVNSPIFISGILLGTSSSLFGLIINIMLITKMGTAIQKDYQYNTHSLFFTKPISKSQYFFGRLSSTFLVSLLIVSGLLIGYYLGSLFGMGTPYVGEYKFQSYIMPFLVFILPNVLFLGALFFAVTTFLRNTMYAYLIAIILMFMQMMSGVITNDMENKTLAGLLEPSGNKALSTIIEYWSPAERNENAIPLDGLLLWNRLFWLGIAILITGISYFKFSFSQFLQPLQLFKRKEENENSLLAPIDSINQLPIATRQFTWKANLKKAWYLGKFEYGKIVRSIFYIIMCLLGVGFMLITVKFMNFMYQTPTYLVTYKLTEGVIGSMGFMSFIFIIFYTGTIIWREREHKVDELVGASPISNTTLFASKAIGLILACALLHFIATLICIGIQLSSGFYLINYGLYFVNLLTTLLGNTLLIVFCLSIQSYVGNKYLGFFMCLLPLIILPMIFGLLEWDLFLLEFNSNGFNNVYSDMNGFGNDFIQFPFYKIYWISITCLLAMFAILLYARGKEKSLKARFKLSLYFFNGSYKLQMLAVLAIAIGFGSYLFYQKKIVEDSTSSKKREKLTADYEKKYKKYEHLLQPRIVATIVHVDMFTKTGQLHVAGVYTLKNKNAKPLDSLYISYIDGKKSSYSFSKLQPSVGFKEVLYDQEYGIKIFKLNTPLQPNDSINFEFDMWYKPKNYFAKAYSEIYKNGTFINNNLFPSIGYNENAELSQNMARIEYGLPPKQRMANVSDSIARMNNYISNDADWIRFETTVSTDEGQIAIAPGYLQKDWIKDGRHYFSYKMDSPILNFYSFLSADYLVKKEQWNNVPLEIYYQKGHEYNLDRMMKAMKKSLDYYTTNFSPYQHKQLRIIEFPRYEAFAQSFPNTIPYSEEMGFMVKVDDKDPLSIDVPFYVTAHEVAHQWWAHQVIGGNVQGSVLMSETMSQYSALMVMEKEYGKDAMKKFLKYEMDQYLKGRTFENKNEMPLMLVENQQYIHYNKGSIVMYALKDYIGEATLNNAIKAYLDKVKFSGPIYTNSIEFVDYIKKATPDSLQYLVTDMFEKITLYENYVKKLDYTKVNDTTYTVNLTLGCAKFYAGNTGNLSKASVNDYVDIGIFTTQKMNNKDVDKPIFFTRAKMNQQEKTFQFTVKEKPISAGIDPYLKLIDRTPKNNSCKFGLTPEKPNLDLKGKDFSILIGNK